MENLQNVIYRFTRAHSFSEFAIELFIAKYRYANYVAKLSVNPNADAPKWVRTANGNSLDYIIEHSLD